MGRALTAWRQGFQREYADKSEAWRQAYLNLGESKLGWVKAVEVKAAQAGNESILSEVGASADDSSRNAGTLMIGGMSYDPNEASAQVEALLSEVPSDQSLSALRRVNAGIGQSQAVVARAGLSVDVSGARIAAGARRFVAQSRSELSAMAARELADNARQSVQEAKKALAESVKQANEGFDTSMDNTFSEAGYARSSGTYTRDTIMRSTLFSTVTEDLRVAGYMWYAMPVLQLKVDLSQGRLAGLEAGAVIDLVGAAQEEVGEAQKRIFGEGKELSQAEKKARGLVVDFSANGASVTKEMGEGEFGAHIGYAPEFTDEPDFDKSQKRNIVVSGKGELGRLMGDFIWNEMREGRGWSEMALPQWDKPLWDDTGSWFKSPSIRSVGTIAAGLLATVATGGIGGIAGIAAAAAISTSSTLLFDGLDVAYGYKTWEEAGLDIGKSFLTSTVTSTIGGVFNGFDPGKIGGLTGALGASKSVVGKALLAGAQTFTTNTATSAINAFNWSNGKLGWDTDSFMTGSFGMGALASVAGAAGAAGMSTALGNWNLYDGSNVDLSKQVFNRKSIESFNSLAGGLTSTGIQYGMTGEATLNVMNFTDFGGDASYGLMEMHLGGSRGFGMNFGSSGTNVSLGTLGASMSGLRDTVKITGAKAAAAFGDQRGISTLNAINMMGYTDIASNNTTAKAIWSDKLNVRYDSISGDNGYYNRDNPNEVVISSAFLGGGKDEAAKLATVLSHEGTHYTGNRIEAVAHQTGLKTYGELTSMFSLTADRGFAQDMIAGIMSAGSWTANTGNTDLWALKVKGGRVWGEWDGTNDITLPDGRVIKVAGLASDQMWAGNASKALFGSKAHYDEMKAAFKEKGLEWNGTAWVYAEGEKKGQSVGARDAFAIDLSAAFGSGEMFGITKEWIEQGAKGVDRRETSGSTGDVFFLLNKARIENELVSYSVYDAAGNVDYEKTKSSWENYAAGLERNATIAGTLVKGLTLGFVDSTPGTEFIQRDAALVADYSEFLLNARLQDSQNGINQYYGPVTPDSNGVFPNGYPYHIGIDIDMEIGDRIRAGFGGIVSSAGPDDNYGNTVTISHMFTFEDSLVNAWFSSRSAHMSSLNVTRGTLVSYSDLIGLAGSTGNSTGPHNHWEIYQPANNPRNLFFTDGLGMSYSTLNSQNQTSSRLRYDPLNMYRNWMRYR